MDTAWLRTKQARALTVFFRRQSLDGLAGAWAIFAALPADLRAGLRDLGGLFDGGGAPPNARWQADVGPVFQSIAAGARPDQWMFAGRRVVFVGVVLPAPELLRVAGAAAGLTVLDHRRSSAARLAELLGRPGAPPPAVVLDRECSAAQLAWDWAHGPALRPAVIDYIADHDLFRFRQPNSRAVSRALATELRDAGFKQLDELRRSPPSRRLRVRGELYLRREAQLVAQAAATARWGVVRVRRGPGAAPAAYRVAAVNSSLLQSEIAAEVLRKSSPRVDLAMVWHVAPGGGEVWASLRTGRADLDLAALAENVLGASSGGGSARVAGFVAPGADVAAVVAPEWRRPAARASKIEAGGGRPMAAAAFNLQLLEQLGDRAEISFAEYLIEYSRFAQKQLFPFADRLQGLSEQKGLVVSERAFGDFGARLPAATLAERAGLIEGRDFSVRPDPDGGTERVFSAEALKRCLLRDAGADKVVDYYLCVESAAAAYGAFMLELLRRRPAPRPAEAQLGGLMAWRAPGAAPRAPARPPRRGSPLPPSPQPFRDDPPRPFRDDPPRPFRDSSPRPFRDDPPRPFRDSSPRPFRRGSPRPFRDDSPRPFRDDSPSSTPSPPPSPLVPSSPRAPAPG